MKFVCNMEMFIVGITNYKSLEGFFERLYYYA